VVDKQILADTLRGSMGTNTNLDDIASVIGYTPTRQLVAWYAGRKLYVPSEPREGHPLQVLLGRSALRRLMHEWAGQHIRIPTLAEDQRLIREREIAEALVAGERDSVLAARFTVTPERIGQIRRALTASGLLDCQTLAQNEN